MVADSLFYVPPIVCVMVLCLVFVLLTLFGIPSSFAIILAMKSELVTLIYLFSARGAVGWSAVCDCGIF